jgi:hypothetical protein
MIPCRKGTAEEKKLLPTSPRLPSWLRNWRRRRLEKYAYAAGLWVLMRLTPSHDRARILSSCYHKAFIWWFMKETAVARGRWWHTEADALFAVDQAMMRLFPESLDGDNRKATSHHPSESCRHCSGSRADAIFLTYMTRGLNEDGSPSAKSSGEFLLDAIRHVRVKFASTLLSFSPWYWALAVI